MLESLVIFALSVYWLFHLLTRSDLTARPRAWVLSWAPDWLAYIGTCAFCFTFHVALGLTLVGVIPFSLVALCAAPVVNMVLDMMVKALMRANEPPVLGEGRTVTQGDQSITTWHGPVMHLGGTIPCTMLPPNTSADWRGIRWARGSEWPWPTDVGRRVKVTAERAYGPAGHGLITGRTGTISRVGPVTCAWAYWITPEGGGQDFSATPTDCTFLDLPDAPFKPLDHEQTK